MASIKTLIHVHTNYSLDSNISPEALARFARSRGIGCIAVTDHDTIDGARHLASITDVKVVIGEEVTTRDGDLIGLFLTHRIEPGLSARETALAIKAQGGVVLAPHPFVKLFGCGLRNALWDIVDLLDAVEICNAQNLLKRPDRDARRFADETGLVTYVGADTHMADSIAPCHQLMRDFSGPDDFLEALGSAELRFGRHPLWYFASSGVRTIRYLLGFRLPVAYGLNCASEAQPTPATAEPLCGRSAMA